MGFGYGGYPDYVKVAEKRANAAGEVARRRKAGEKLAPVVLEGRAIAKSFWGKAWCDNLEAYRDFDYRLDRGRSYLRNGAVIDLKVDDNAIAAKVSGSEVYEVSISIARISKGKWATISRDCVGGVASMIELLQGKLSKPVMERICRRADGLFPRPEDIKFKCNCYDWADMCKHVAAVMYGVGHRMDNDPTLIFTLRKVSADDLITQLDAGNIAPAPAYARVLEADDMAALFGLDMVEPDAKATAKPRRAIIKSEAKPAASGRGNAKVMKGAKAGKVGTAGKAGRTTLVPRNPKTA